MIIFVYKTSIVFSKLSLQGERGPYLCPHPNLFIFSKP